MVFNQTEVETLLDSLNTKRRELTQKTGDIQDIITQLESIKDIRVNKLKQDGTKIRDPDTNEVITEIVVPTDIATKAKITSTRRNNVYDANKILADAILAS